MRIVSIIDLMIIMIKATLVNIVLAVEPVQVFNHRDCESQYCFKTLPDTDAFELCLSLCPLKMPALQPLIFYLIPESLNS